MDKRRAFKLAMAVAFLAVVGAHQWTKMRKDKGQSGAAQGAPIVQRGGERGFTLGTLRFEPCELGQRNSAATTAAFCAPFEVPENWDKPDGRRIGLRLAMLRSDAAAAEHDPVVMLAGGPGQAATESFPRVAGAFAPLLRKRNVVLMDQRGTGGSHALDCAQDSDADLEDAEPQDIDLAKVKRDTQACLDKVAGNADPAQYTTTAAVRDLEALRQAMGAPRFNLVGVSYGTRVAQQYLMRHPDGVRSIVLDSPVPNDVVLGGEFARNLDDSLKAQFAACTKDAACAKAFGDPYANLYRLRDRLAAQPAKVEMRHPRTGMPEQVTLGAMRLAGLARMFAYAPETAALLPLAISRSLDGDHAALAGQSEYITAEMSDLIGSGMQLSVICAEDADLVRDNPGEAHLLLGDAFTRVLREQCTVWPRGTRPPDFHQPVTGDTPLLILSGEFDPVTPPRYGEAILKGLTNARQLVAAGQGHSVMGRGCLPKLAARFIDTLQTKTLDAGCIADFGPTPAFIDFNGAAP